MNRKVIYSLVAVAFVFFLVSLFIFLGSQRGTEVVEDKPPVGEESEEGGEPVQVKVKAFFFTNQSQFMRPVTLELTNSGEKDETYRQFIDLIIQDQKDYITPVPQGLALRTLFYVGEKKMLVLDFNDNLINRFPSGSRAELEFIYFIVDNICFNFDEIKMVKFLVGGNEYETISGHIDIENPFYPDYRYLKID